jgi:hypothetical protein
MQGKRREQESVSIAVSLDEYVSAEPLIQVITALADQALVGRSAVLLSMAVERGLLLGERQADRVVGIDEVLSGNEQSAGRRL